MSKREQESSSTTSSQIQRDQIEAINRSFDQTPDNVKKTSKKRHFELCRTNNKFTRNNNETTRDIAEQLRGITKRNAQFA
jgi:bisphosphoglycerate-dependent phosphoglycerate mutase